MTRVIVVGAGSAKLAAALRALDGAKAALTRTSRSFFLCADSLNQVEWLMPPTAKDDPFAGGGRSKGEKKRAARERRMRGGY